MTLTQVKTFQPGEVRTAQITVLNTGNQAAVYALEITAGETGVFGFALQRSPVLVLTPQISPGQQRQIPVPVQLPDAPGPKAFRIRIGQAGPTGQIIQEFDEELFTGFAQVALPTMIPLPTEPPALPAAPTSQELALRFRDALGAPSITVSPTQVDQGETVRGTLSIPSAAAIPFTPRLTVTLVEFQFTARGDQLVEVRTLISPKDVPLAPGEDISEPFSINTSTIPPGLYGLRVHMMDSATGIVLIDQTFTELFTINLPAAIEPPTVTPPTLSTADLQLAVPSASPSQVNRGQTVAITVPITNRTAITPPLQLDVRPFHQATGQNFAAPFISFTPTGTQSLTAQWEVPSDAPLGDYGVRILVTDVTAGVFLIQSGPIVNIFEVLAAPAPTPTPTPTPTPAPIDGEEGPTEPTPAPLPRPSDLRITISYGPSITRFGQQTTLTVQVTNIGDFNFGVEVEARLMLPDTNFGQEIIPRTFGLLIVDQRRLFTGVLSTANLPGGSYGARVTVRRASDGRIITVVNQPGILNVISGGL